MKQEKQAVTQICPLCDRPIPKGAPQSRHHLIPKLKGGKGGDTVLLHHQCHKEIHARISESELATIFSICRTKNTSRSGPIYNLG